MKGVSTLVSSVLYIAMTVAAVTVATTVGLPQIQKMQDATIFYNARDAFANLDKTIEKVASEGRGSVRVVPLEIKKGTVVINGAGDSVDFSMETSSAIISPRSMLRTGNLVIGSNIDVNATENVTHYVLENTHLRTVVSKYGNATTSVSYGLSELVREIKFKDSNQQLPFQYLNISLNDLSNTTFGSGYTELSQSGTSLGNGKVIAHMNSNNGNSYDVNIMLESECDCIQIWASNYV